MMKQWMKKGGLLLVVLTVFSAAALADQSGDKYTWKVGTLAPRGVGWAKQVEDIVVPSLDEVTGGALYLKVYWGGVMGDDEDVIRKMRVDQLQSAGLTAQGAFMACPEFAVLQLPFLIRDYDEVDYLREKMHGAFDEMMLRHGFRLYMWIDQDFDQVYSIHKPLGSLEDFSGVKCIKWNSEVEEGLLNALGANPIPVNVPEISASMRQGVAEALIAPAIWMVGAQMHSVVRYVNPTKMRYSPAVIIVSDLAWGKVPPGHITKAMVIRDDLVQQFVKGTRADNAKCLKAMVEYGVQEVQPSQAALKALEQKTRPVWDELAGEVYEQEILDEILEHLEAYRAEKGGA